MYGRRYRSLHLQKISQRNHVTGQALRLYVHEITFFIFKILSNFSEVSYCVVFAYLLHYVNFILYFY